MKKKEQKLLSYGWRDFPALSLAMVFVGCHEIEKFAKRLCGIEGPPKPKASVSKQNKLISEIFG